MWNLLRNDETCQRLRDLLEDSAAARPEAVSVGELSQDWPAVDRAHIASCANCEEAAKDLLTTRELFKGVTSDAGTERLWFATRVMAAIAARERELKEKASTWLAVPKFASRLALASGAALLIASTWLYERPLPAPNLQATALAAQESLFEATPAVNQDDVLVNTQENNR
ncbi:MAG TPA: hypothetical protein VJO16_20925 [Candidatus Acidoferrum sp.]|nr:hypothetical protein [Candidatus Acidoferrum sp.]